MTEIINLIQFKAKLCRPVSPSGEPLSAFVILPKQVSETLQR